MQMSALNEQISALEGKIQTKFDEMAASVTKVERHVQQVEQMALAKICLRQMIQLNLNAYKVRLFGSTSCWPRNSGIATVTSALCGKPIGTAKPDEAITQFKKKAKNRRKRQSKKNRQAASQQPSSETMRSGSDRAEASTMYRSQASVSSDGYQTATSCDEARQFGIAKEKLAELHKDFKSVYDFAAALENQNEWGKEELHHTPGKLLAEWVVDAQTTAKAETESEVEANEKAKNKFQEKFDYLITKEKLNAVEVRLMVDWYWFFLSEKK